MRFRRDGRVRLEFDNIVAQNGEIPALKVGGRWLFKKTDIEHIKQYWQNREGVPVWLSETWSLIFRYSYLGVTSSKDQWILRSRIINKGARNKYGNPLCHFCVGAGTSSLSSPKACLPRGSPATAAFLNQIFALEMSLDTPNP